MALFHVSAPIGPWPGQVIEADNANGAMVLYRLAQNVPDEAELTADEVEQTTGGFRKVRK